MILLNQNKKRYKIDYSKPVQVYRNLHKGCWSVKQNGLVKAHSDDITMFDCEFLVNQNNRLKVIREKRKNVHAFVKGILSKYCHKHDHRRWGKVKSISYNPYKLIVFMIWILMNPFMKQTMLDWSVKMFLQINLTYHDNLRYLNTKFNHIIINKGKLLT